MSWGLLHKHVQWSTAHDRMSGCMMSCAGSCCPQQLTATHKDEPSKLHCNKICAASLLCAHHAIMKKDPASNKGVSGRRRRGSRMR